MSAHARPSDSFGNPYVQADTAHVCSAVAELCGTALYSCQQARGGTGHQVTVAKPIGSDETTLSVVEIVNGGRLLDAKWSEVAAGLPLTSPAITTSGPALLVAWWWGDADVRFDKTATPDNAFTVIDCESFSRAPWFNARSRSGRSKPPARTTSRGPSTPLQGAQLWIAAVQSAPAAAVPGAPI